MALNLYTHFVSYASFICTRDAKGFFEDPEPQGSPANFNLRNPEVFILEIFATFGVLHFAPGNPGEPRGFYFCQHLYALGKNSISFISVIHAYGTILN